MKNTILAILLWAITIVIASMIGFQMGEYQGENTQMKKEIRKMHKEIKKYEQQKGLLNG